jgi:hypothetical protein
MAISHDVSIANGFLRQSRSKDQNHTNYNDQPGGSTPFSIPNPLTIDSDPLMGPRTDWKGMTGSSESVLAFAVAGIHGAGRLASRLNQLESVDLIGPWHVGHWIDHTHTVIRIRFNSRADARTALINVGFAPVHKSYRPARRSEVSLG